MKKNLIILVVSLLIFSCNQKPEADDKPIPVNMTDTIVTEKEKEKPKEENQQLGDTISLTFKDDKGSYIAEGVIDSLHPRVYIKFTNENAGNLKASVKPLGVGNIRFNQIIFPDKTSDGPFGQDVEQPLSQTGVHSLVIGHSLMADNPYNGRFMVRVQLAENE